MSSPTSLSSRISRVFGTTFSSSTSTSSSSSSSSTSSTSSTYNSVNSFPIVNQFGVLATSSHPHPGSSSPDPSTRLRAKRPSLVAYDLSRKEKSRLRKWEASTWPTLDGEEKKAAVRFHNEEIASQSRQAGF